METENKTTTSFFDKNKLSTPAAIIVAGVLIAGAIYFSGLKKNSDDGISINSLNPVQAEDQILGNTKAKVTLILYTDFQCPFCGAVSGYNQPVIDMLKQRDPNWTPFVPEIIKNYVQNDKLSLVHRDWAFLGEESIKAAVAARCAAEQGKFWEYHDSLYAHQKGENEGNYSEENLKSFAQELSLDQTAFADCLSSEKYNQSIDDSRKEGDKAGVKGTPKGFILRDGKIVDTIDGAESYSTVKEKIEAALAE